MADENKELEQPTEADKEIEKLKRMLSDANSEAAKYKKELRAKQTADEQAEADRLEKFTAMENELNQLRKDKEIDKFTSDFMELGFDRENAIKVAKAKADGDNDTVFASLKAQMESVKKSALTDAMNNQGGLTNGEPPKQKQFTQDDIKKMSREEINANWDAIQKSLKK